jgi:hypothetical protein
MGQPTPRNVRKRDHRAHGCRYREFGQNGNALPFSNKALIELTTTHARTGRRLRKGCGPHPLLPGRYGVTTNDILFPAWLIVGQGFFLLIEGGRRVRRWVRNCRTT